MRVEIGLYILYKAFICDCRCFVDLFCWKIYPSDIIFVREIIVLILNFNTMKKAILILLTIISLGITAGCSREDSSEAPAKERILGKWKFISLVTETTRPSEPVEIVTKPGAEGDYFDFRNDGNIYYALGGNEEQIEPYSIENETTLKINNDVCVIKELTQQKLVFEFVKVNANYTSKQTYNLGR